MYSFSSRRDAEGNTELQTHLQGKNVLNSPQLNKGTAFTEEERHELGLLGKLPSYIEGLEEQVNRAYEQYCSFRGNLKKNTYLNALHDNNQVLFYALLKKHLAEMIPTIYTPIVGTAVKQFSHEFRRTRGLFISNDNIDAIDEILANRTHPEVDIIVVTDGEGVLGIGDQGIGGMDIPIAKLMVYSACGHINHLRTLPICLDVGTDNSECLDDPMYLGLRHKRIRGEAYHQFVDRFVKGVQKAFPWVFLHWEDFGRDNGRHNLNTYRDQLCSFNDDIQGTGAITVAALLAAVQAKQSTLTEQNIVVFGAGSAGTGITDQICDAMVRSGLKRAEAIKRFWLIDRQGLLMADTSGLTQEQMVYARDPKEIESWALGEHQQLNLAAVVAHTKPTVLLGCSSVAGAFDEDTIKAMHANCPRPIIMPLSNPTERAEATPHDLLHWTKGEALVATGSPFDPVLYEDRSITTAQCNNALSFPGIGLAMAATHAKKLTDTMLWAASQAIAKQAPILEDQDQPLLPKIEDAQELAYEVAKAVVKQVREAKLDTANQSLSVESAIKQQMWEPVYPRIRAAKD